MNGLPRRTAPFAPTPPSSTCRRPGRPRPERRGVVGRCCEVDVAHLVRAICLKLHHATPLRRLALLRLALRDPLPHVDREVRRHVAVSRPPPAAPESKAALLAVLAVDGVPELNAAEFAVLVVEGPPELVDVVPTVCV